MSLEKQHSEGASPSEFEKGLQASLAEKRAGRVFGPFIAAEETMEFLGAFQREFTTKGTKNGIR
jgi:hypothetical protein